MRNAAVAAFGVVAVFAAVVSGCSRPPVAAPVSGADLQRGLSERLAVAGTPPRSVTCPRELRGLVGSTARCEVVFSDTDSVDAILTTTEVRDGTVNWEITGPELTKLQLAKRVAAERQPALAPPPSPPLAPPADPALAPPADPALAPPPNPVRSVTCDSGLPGIVGSWATCQVTTDSYTMTRIPEVQGVKMLAIELNISYLIPARLLEERLISKIAATGAVRPAVAKCEGDLIGTAGSSVMCKVDREGSPRSYLLTMTLSGDGRADFVYSEL